MSDPTSKIAEICPDAMISIQGGRFHIGSDRFYPEERPVRDIEVSPFWIDETPVTNEDFAKFVAATDYVTLAETAPDICDYPGMSPDMQQAGSLVFKRTAGPVDVSDVSQWWAFEFKANWRHPLGAESCLDGLEHHPVVHIAHQDASAYAQWAGKQLPTEAEWEVAARGGLDRAEFAWGDELNPDGAMLANYWQGLFPFANQLLDGWERTSPVRTYPPNGYGLFDMIGNVWEWTDDWWSLPPTTAKPPKKSSKGACCVPKDPRGGRRHKSIDTNARGLQIARKVLKGGSHLCAENYCQRYRPAARHPQPLDTSTSHVGFRCVIRGAEAT